MNEIIPIKAVKKLPELPNDKFPMGMVVYLRKDATLYRHEPLNNWRSVREEQCD